MCLVKIEVLHPNYYAIQYLTLYRPIALEHLFEDYSTHLNQTLGFHLPTSSKNYSTEAHRTTPKTCVAACDPNRLSRVPFKWHRPHALRSRRRHKKAWHWNGAFRHNLAGNRVQISSWSTHPWLWLARGTSLARSGSSAPHSSHFKSFARWSYTKRTPHSGCPRSHSWNCTSGKFYEMLRSSNRAIWQLFCKNAVPKYKYPGVKY